MLENSPVRVAATCAAMLLVVICDIAGLARADETPRVKNEAPPNMAVVGSKLGGTYYAPKPLKEEYDKLTAKVRTLEAEIVGGQISGKAAAEQVRQLKSELEAVRQRIDAEKTFVATAKIHTQGETTTFELGPEKSLLIVADKVRLVGWDQPGIKCVLDKTVLSADDKPADAQFQGIKLEHRHGHASQQHVGLSPADLDESEKKYLESPEGQKLDEPQRDAWRKRFRKIFVPQELFAPLQHKDIDVLDITGLTYQQGNRQILLEVNSRPGGNGHSWSTWQRHASLTVYVPSCEAVGVHGALAGLEVESVKAPLLVRGDGNRDYEGIFRVSDHEGPLKMENLPLQRIDNVRGDVSITVSAYLANAGTSYGGDTKTCYVFPPEEWAYRNITGNLTALFVRANLTVEGVGGRVDITNEFGDTTLVAAKPLAAAAHRLLSQGGGIDVQLAKDALAAAPLLALTECGSVRVDEKLPLADIHFTTWPGNRLIRRGFTGFVQKKAQESPLANLETFERVTLIEENAERSPGLDVLCRGGHVRITSSR